MKFILASGNNHKAEEFSELFDSEVLEISAAVAKVEVEETGSTYHENAFQKAQAYYNRFNKPVVSDDSGLNVEALPDQLGVHSARFGGEGLSDQGRASLLLDKMKEQKKRKAHFSCVLCFYLNPDEVFFFEGRLEGSIANVPRGEQGFGYDPVFLPEGVPDDASLAMIPDWKKLYSHRAVASAFAQTFFRDRSISL